MNRWLLFVVALIFVRPVAAQTIPDFSGNWTADPERAVNEYDVIEAVLRAWWET